MATHKGIHYNQRTILEDDQKGAPLGIFPHKRLWLKSKYPIYIADVIDFVIEPFHLLCDKSKFINILGILSEILLYLRFSVSRTGILPSESGMCPNIRFNDRSRSAKWYILEIVHGIRPVIQLWDSNAWLSIASLPKFHGIIPPDISRNLARDDVAGEINDAEEWQGCDTAREDIGNTFPIGDGDVGKPSEVAYVWRDETDHITRAGWQKDYS